jgi:hypothetical protein
MPQRAGKNPKASIVFRKLLEDCSRPGMLKRKFEDKPFATPAMGAIALMCSENKKENWFFETKILRSKE